jgi:hypothetical protein
MNRYIRRFSEIGLGNVPSVGGANGSLGGIFHELTRTGSAVLKTTAAIVQQEARAGAGGFSS